MAGEAMNTDRGAGDGGVSATPKDAKSLGENKSLSAVPSKRSELYLLDIGYVEDTILYELRPVPIARFSQQALADIVDKMVSNGVRHIVVDSAQPREADLLISHGFNIIQGRLPRVTDLVATDKEPK